MSFWAELRRRNVFRVGAAYVVVTWLLVQISATIFPLLNLPKWAATLVTIFLILGFPVALLMAWAYEVTPEGIKKTRSVPAEQSISHVTGQRLNYVITGLLLLLVAFMAADNYLLPPRATREVGPASGDAAAGSDVASTSQGDGTAESAPTASDSGRSTVLPNSLAVLPFENLSPKSDDAYFAAGLHEEVLNQLAKLHNLNVIARTTMRHYENTDKSIEQIAGELNVGTVMEGTVRYADGHVRVTTQLIDGRRGVHLWSHTYDRDFEHVFDVESDIAMNVANAMRVEFSSQEQARIEKAPTDSPEAYALLLSAMQMARGGTRDGITRALERMDRATGLDPNFALAWSLEASLDSYAQAFFPERIDEYRAAAEKAARRALEIDPGFGPGHTALAMIASNRGDWRLAATEFNRASALGNIAGALEPFAAFQFIVGHIEDGYKTIVTLRKHDPLNSDAAWWAVEALDIRGDSDASLMEYQRGKEIFDPWPIGRFHAFVTLLGKGDSKRALELGRSLLKDKGFDAVLQNFDMPGTALAELRTIYAENASADRQYIAVLAAYFHDSELAFDALRDAMNELPIRGHLMWRPVFREVRQRQDFKDFLRQQGFVVYWQEFGWPSLCRPLGHDDFECN